MMTGFLFFELEPGEEILFGPVTTTRSISVSSAPAQQPGMPQSQHNIQQQQATHTSGKTVGVTNRRVVVEDLNDSGKTKIIPNEQVRRVFVKAGRHQGQPSLTLERVATAAGDSIKLNIQGLPDDVAAIQAAFPQAEIVQRKGSPVLKIVAILGGIVIFLACVLPLLIFLVGKLFGN